MGKLTVKSIRAAATARNGRVQRVVSLSGYSVPEDAKREIVNIWLDFDGNEARQILEAFRLGFKTGATAQANAKLTDCGENQQNLNAENP